MLFQRSFQGDAFGHALLDVELDLVVLAQIRQKADHGHAADSQALRDLVLRLLLDKVHPCHAQPHALATVGTGGREFEIWVRGDDSWQRLIALVFALSGLAKLALGRDTSIWGSEIEAGRRDWMGCQPHHLD